MTDFSGSTRHTARVGDAAMVGWWAEQDRLVRDLLIAWRGVELERTDGFVAIFDGDDDALSCIEAYQAELKTSGFPLQARAVVHAGPLTLTEAPAHHRAIGAKRFEADGLAKAVASRVLAIAAGGQTLATPEMRFAAAAASRVWRSRGYWLAKGIDEPFEVFEMRGEAGFAEPPTDDLKCYRVVRSLAAWAPARDVTHTLPGERSSFVGRRAELESIASMIERRARLVTICGMGGVGKTRLAVRFAWAHLGDFDGGTWFCDLAQVESLEGLHSAVARGLGISLSGDEPSMQIGRAIEGRGRCLVILDNFEQITEHAEATVGDWLASAPTATFMVTTREQTGIDGEESVRIDSMAAEDGSDLFLRRAKAVHPSYEPTEGDQTAIDRLVASLDGLPLAIELAAARVRILSPPDLLARLHSRFDWLHSTRGRRGRQATLRAAFDWSWELLSVGERQSLARLSVFDGGFDLRSAAGVIGGQVGHVHVAEMVESLLAKSLIGQVGNARYRLLESVREYASLQLRSANGFPGSGADAAHHAERSHWRHFGYLDEATATLASADVGNVVVACQRATMARDLDGAPASLRVAWLVLRLVGPFRLGLDLASAVLAIEGLSDNGKAIGHWVAASSHRSLGEADAARRHLAEGLACARQGSGGETLARLLITNASARTSAGEFDEAANDLAEAQALARARGDLRMEAHTLLSLGTVLDVTGQLEKARARYEDGLTLSRQAGDLRLEGGMLGNLGGICRDLGQLSEARMLFERSVRIARLVGDRQWEGNGCSNLGLLCQEQGDRTAAREHLTAAAHIARTIGHVALGYVVDCNLGILASEEDQLGHACGHFERAVEAAAVAGDGRAEGQFRGYLGDCLARLGRFDDARVSLERGRHLLIAADDRLSHALLLCQTALAEERAGHGSAALAAAEDARAIARDLHTEPSSELGRSLARLPTG